MSSNEEAIKLNLYAIVYPEAPDNFEEIESGKLILNSSELLLPGDISFSLNQLKTARYVKIEEVVSIKVRKFWKSSINKRYLI